MENGFSKNLLYYNGRIKNEPVRVLVDGGSMGNFVSAAVAHRLRLNLSTVPDHSVRQRRAEYLQ